MIQPSLVVDNIQKVSFKEAKIVPGDSNSAFYLNVTYRVENLHGVFELYMPKISLKDFFKPDVLPHIVHDEEPFELWNERNSLVPRVSPNFIFDQNNNGALILEEDKILDLGRKGFEVKMIKKKEWEMTLEEIEKKLGHKIKIISKEG